MTEKCFDIGTIQAFLDGELASDLSEKVACHTASCDDCAIMLAEAEEESVLAFSALESEFNTFVPTNRLWTKINDSIEKQKKPFWQTILERFTNPTVAAFASLVIIVGLFAVMLTVKTDDNGSFVAGGVPVNQTNDSQITKPNSPEIAQNDLKTNVSATEPQVSKVTSSENEKSKSRVVKATFSEKENSLVQPEVKKSNSVKSPFVKPDVRVESNAASENLLGEESYVRTIATLEKTVESSKDEVLKPAARFAFERDLAVTDNAIKTMKAEVKKNPKNEAAKEVLRASYQNKIELLNSVAEKSDLMASLK